ncbi:MAG TPA: formate dehydrogenase, partial [Reyranella sp.]
MKIFVPRDAAARAVGADKVVVALVDEARKHNLAIEIVRTGSRGLFWLETMIEVETADGRIGFGPVAARDVPALVTGRFERSHPLCLGKPEEISFLKRQTRITFARCGIIDPLSLDDYRAHGGWRGLERARSLGPSKTLEEVTKSGLRGRGGAGFPTGIKWKTVADAAADQKYIVCNADEGDSGTYADRMIMEGDPFLLIEGIAIAGLAVGATKGYVYIRSEYPNAIRVMQRAVELSPVDGFEIEIRVGAGAYVCGEETSLLESLEGKRGQVRAKPPLPAHKGLFGKPTVINNLISLATVPFI